MPDFPKLPRRLVSRLVPVAATFALTLAAGCSQGMNDENIADPNGTDKQPSGSGSYDACALPNENCPCNTPNETIACGEVVQKSGGYVWCSPGTRTCEPHNGTSVWGACNADRSIAKKVPVPGVSKGTADLAVTAGPCENNPCDPYCLSYSDDATCFDLDGGSNDARWSGSDNLEINDDGITIAPCDTSDGGVVFGDGGAGDGGTCTLTVTPAADTVTVTSNSPFTTSPASVTYIASFKPDGCFTQPFTALWAIDRQDIATIDADGKLNVFAPVAGPITVTAYAGPLKATATANVKVNITEIYDGVDKTKFDPSATVDDTFKVLYPYNETLFPIGIVPPVIQWDSGTATNLVKTTLIYPPGASTPDFSWSFLRKETTPPREKLSQEAWDALSLTAQGKQAGYTIQRVTGGTLKKAVSRTVRFAEGPLRGRIYYTEYTKNSIVTGKVGSIAGDTALLRILNPSNKKVDPAVGIVADPAIGPTNAFASNDNGCPVCHSMSSNGKVFAATRKATGGAPDNGLSADNWGGINGGLSSVNFSTGVLARVTDFQDALRPSGGTDWRGFAWAPITPDGMYALGSNNIWGNTTQTIPSGVAIGSGVGTGLVGFYYNQKTYGGTFTGNLKGTRVDPIINFNWNGTSPWSGVIPNHNFSGNGTYPCENWSAVWTGYLVAPKTETYTFQIDADDGVQLYINGSTVINQWTYPQFYSPRLDNTDGRARGTINLTAGQLVPIELRYFQEYYGSRIRLQWSSPSVSPLQDVPTTRLYPYYPSDPASPGTGTGLLGSYYDQETYPGSFAGGNTPSTLKGTRLDPTINFTWNAPPGFGSLPKENWSARWVGYLMPAVSENYTFETLADDGVQLIVNGAMVINQWAYPQNYSPKADGIDGKARSGAVALQAGKLVPIELRYFQELYDSKIQLSWSSPSTPLQVIPTSQLYPTQPSTPAGAGLQAAYYDNKDLTGRAWTRIDSQIAFSAAASGNFPPNPSKYPDPSYPVPSSIEFSARWIGQIEPPCTGTYTFETSTDDGVRLWIDGQQIIEAWTERGTYSSRQIKLTQGQKYDLQLDYWQGGGPATAVLNWSADCGGLVKTNVPMSALTRAFSGTKPNAPPLYPRKMSTGVDYDVWKVSDGAGTIGAPWPTKVTGSFSGLTGYTMMVPSFSHDGKHLVFIDGSGKGITEDSATPGDGAAGWRKGLSVLDFDQTLMKFTNRRLLRDTYHSCGDVMKWPTWEPDSRSVIFQTSTPTETCESCVFETVAGSVVKPAKALNQDLAKVPYGHMAPTNYYQTSGRLWSIDADDPVNHPAVPLDKLNVGEDETSYTAYQATALPVSSGGYRWAVFTSTRPYGNHANESGSDISCIGSQFWVAAIDDVTSGTTDRSHPAFWLPKQNVSDNKGKPNTKDGTTGSACVPHFTNERAFWVNSACVANGQSCDVNEDCCGGAGSSPTAVCRLDVPVNPNNPTRHCAALSNPSGICTASGSACNSSIDCCDFSTGTTQCIGGLCQAPPALPSTPSTSLDSATFTRDYEAACPSGTKGTWRFFDWQTVTPGDSSIDFAAQTADAPAGLTSAPSVALGSASGVPNTTWTGADVGAALSSVGQESKRWLRVSVVLNPGPEAWMLPTLTKWKQDYSCLPSE